MLDAIGFALVALTFVVLFLLGRGLARGPWTWWAVGWRLALAAGLLALLTVPDAWAVGLTGLAVAAAGSMPLAIRVLRRTAAGPRAQRLRSTMRRHWILTMVVPFAAVVTIDRLVHGRWTLPEAVLGGLELAVWVAAIGTRLRRDRRGPSPLIGGVAIATLVGILDRPFVPVTAEGLGIGAVVALALASIALAERWRRGRRPPPAPSGV